MCTCIYFVRHRIRRNRLHLLPLEDMDGSDDSNSDDDDVAGQRDGGNRNVIPVSKAV